MQNSRIKRRGIYLLPNLITTTSLFFGFFAMVRALNGDFESAALAVFVCAILDALDGSVARMTNTSTRFGAEYDSLSDAVVFGMVPAISVYLWAFSGFEPGQLEHRIGWLVAFFYTASTVLRLARFNVQAGTENKYFFRGMASPCAAVLVMSLIWSCEDFGYTGEQLIWPVAAIVAAVSVAMVSNLSYYSLKGLNLRNRIPFVAVLVIIVGFIVAAVDLPRFLFFVFLTYALSGPFLYFIRHWRKLAPLRRSRGSNR